ncbi:MAG: thioredoxin family protein [Bacteroidetes bacterium]|nr:thioredoxin family protein [Bacteroidota bacterium]
MKNATITKLFFTIFLAIVLKVGANAQQQMVQGKLEYMMKESQDKVFEVAKAENKPVLIYIHSQTCFSSKKFSREIMNHEKVKTIVRKKYVCMNADVATTFGKQMAAKHNILLMPALVLYSPDKGIMFQCKLQLDTFEMMTQFRSFISACNLLEQVKMQQSTSDKSQKEIIRQIGRSYAMKDFQRDKNGEVSQRVTLRTLNIEFFKDFEIGYKEEYETLLASNGKKSSGEAASIR